MGASQGADSEHISIHALLAESDESRSNILITSQYFYPRSPCGERREREPALSQSSDFYPRSPCGERRLGNTLEHLRSAFLSTLSLRRATLAPEENPTEQRNFYPRSPCGERPMGKSNRAINGFISIHALLAESDFSAGRESDRAEKFLSTLSLRRATSE